MQQLAQATQQNQYQHLFNNILTYDGTDKDKFFHWLDELQGAFLMSGWDCRLEAFAKSAEKVKNTLASIDVNTPWSKVRSMLIREFSHLTTPTHACAYLDSLQQKTLESLKLYNYRYSFYHHLVMGKEARDNQDPSCWMKYLASIRNTAICDQMSNSSKLPLNLEDCMGQAVRIESSHKLAEGINKMCQLPMLKEDDKVNEVTIEEIGDPRAQTGNCYGCEQVGHFFDDCTNPDKFEYRKENHPYPPNKGSTMDWHLNIGTH